MSRQLFDVIIIGGSYSGLSAGMTLGRSLKDVLIIDSGKPCNSRAPHSYNFLAHDGDPPNVILEQAKAQIKRYETVTFHAGLATKGVKTDNGFEITTEKGERFRARKLIFASGIKDCLPDIKGFAECWGVSLIHCPYCHGYEVRGQKTGILGNGNYGFELSKLINNWTKDLVLFTNGPFILRKTQKEKLEEHRIPVIEKEIERLDHSEGRIESIVFKDGSKTPVEALYLKAPFVQHCDIPSQLGCSLTKHGLIKIDRYQRTTVAGVLACGDNCTSMRTVSRAVSMGNVAGSMANKEITEESF